MTSLAHHRRVMLKIKLVGCFLLQALHEVVRAAGLQLLLHHW